MVHWNETPSARIEQGRLTRPLTPPTTPLTLLDLKSIIDNVNCHRRQHVDAQLRRAATGWHRRPPESLPVLNPATGEQVGTTPLSTATDVGQARRRRAAGRFPRGAGRPSPTACSSSSSSRRLLERHFDDISRTITLECGKTLAESRGEMRRAVENVDVACGTPILIQGYNSEDIAAGIDEIMIRQPLGVCAVVAPFNFPGMIPFWFIPYAIACGNTVVIKPSERVPLTMQKVFELVDAIGLPPGVLNLVNGGRDVVNALLDHPAVRSVSFVGSSAVARQVYARAAAAGKRAQCQGGAKNPVVVLPDADLAAGRRRHCRQRVRLCRPALPRHVARDHRRRRARAVSRRDSRESAQSRVVGLRPRRGRADGAGHLARKPRARRQRDRSGRRRRCACRSSTAEGSTAAVYQHGQFRAVRRSSTGCRFGASSRARRFSVPCCRRITSTPWRTRSRS